MTHSAPVRAGRVAGGRGHVDSLCLGHYGPGSAFRAILDRRAQDMKIRNSLKSLKRRHRDCRVIRRKGRVYVINKTNRRFKARQG